MKRFSMLLVIALALALLTATTVYGQGNNEKNFAGQILKVDTSAKLIDVQDADGKVVTFKYGDNTMIVNSDKTSQGLTGKAGARALITYNEKNGVNLASRIELTE